MTTSSPPDRTDSPPPDPASPDPALESLTSAATQERRARPRRSAGSQRAAWMAARARNAARRFGLIATVGGIAVVGTLLVLILLPREVNRALQAQLDAIPEPRDTVPLLARRDATARRRVAADAALAARRAAAAAAAAQPVDAPSVAGTGTVAGSRDSLGLELQQRLTRARSSPNVESFRALADARLLQGNGRVRALLDSLEGVEREREAYAALGGPDARYASLTARLTALGQRIVGAAEAALPAPGATSPSAPVPAVPAAVATSPVTPGDSLVADSAALLAASRSLYAARAAAQAESMLVVSAAAAADSLRRVEAAIDSARRTNAAIAARERAVRSRSSVIVPPTAMLLAALVLGLALGYAGAMLIELRRPTVGDEAEVERLAQSRVITHTGAPIAVRELRTRRRVDRALPAVLEPTAEAWPQLHLTLTGLGDVVRTVRVVADQPMLGGTLALNLAAAAAHESRATLLVELPSRSPVLSHLLRQPRARGLTDVRAGRAELREVIVETPVGRDTTVDVLFAGAPHDGGAGSASFEEELRRMAARYDLTLVVGESTAESSFASRDVILCGRLGVTSLDWLSHTTASARGAGHRLRAVLLWATDLPVA